MKKHFKRTTKLRVIAVLLIIAGIIVILASPPMDDMLKLLLLTIAFAVLTFTLLYGFCIAAPDYDFCVEYKSPYIVFRMSEDNVLVFMREHMKIEKKNKHYLIISDVDQRTLIPYSKDLEKFLEKLL